MSVQRNILSFFKPSPLTQKRNPLVNLENSPMKKFKSSVSDSSDSNDNKNVAELKDKGVQGLNVTNDNLSKEITKNAQNEESCVFNNIPLSSDSKKEIEKKRLKAKLKLMSKTLPILDADMGLTWFAALEKEFSKPYFKKVSTVCV